MVNLEHLGTIPEATRIFILDLASRGDPIAAAIVNHDLDPNQVPPVLTERELKYLSATVTILRSEGLLSAKAEQLSWTLPSSPVNAASPLPPAQPTDAVMTEEHKPLHFTNVEVAPPRSAPSTAVPASPESVLMARLKAELPPDSFAKIQGAIQRFVEEKNLVELVSVGASVLFEPHRVSLLDAFKRILLPQNSWSFLDASVASLLLRARSGSVGGGGGSVGGGTAAAAGAATGAGPARPSAPTTAAAAAVPSTAIVAPAALPQAVPSSQNQRVEENEGDVEEEAEDGEHTYSSYIAKTIREIFPNISSHPDPLVETASLASVQLPPLGENTKYLYETLEEDVQLGRLSDAQMESIIYAWTKFGGPRLPDGKRRGFFLGDGAGVGKGRTIAGLVKQHWNAGGKYVLWLSVSQDLRRDARRDLDDLGAQGIEIYNPTGNNQVPDGNFKGVVFITYSLLRSGLLKQKKRKKKAANGASGSRVAELVEVRGSDGNTSGSDAGGDDDESTSLEITNLPATARLAQIIRWLTRGGREGALIVFDESHRAKNLLVAKDKDVPGGLSGGTATQTARAVVHLQESLPNAKILYSSATGASEPKNLAYMTRLWGSHDTTKMVQLLSRSKLASLELAAISLKTTGTYLARTLSYADAEFCLEKVEITPDMDLMYERSAYFWTLLYQVMKVVGSGRFWKGQFWSAHQRFYRSMLMAAKVKKCAELCRDAVASGMSVVVGLQSTGESVTDQMRAANTAWDGTGALNEYDDIVSAPQQILDSFIQKNFPVACPAHCTAQHLESLEYQVWEALKMWKDMSTVDELSELAAHLPPSGATAHAGGAAGGSGGSGAVGSSAAATRETFLTGQNIDAERKLNPEELRRLDNAGEVFASELEVAAVARGSRDKAAKSRAGLIQSRVQAEKLFSDTTKYRQSLLDAVAVAEGTAIAVSPAAATPAPPLAAGLPRTSTASPFVIDLSGDTTDEEEEQQNNALAGCMYCSAPADIGMVACVQCNRKAHAACLQEFHVPVHFTCDTCLIKSEPGAVQIKTEPSVRTVVVDQALLSKTLDELRILLRTANVQVSEAKKQLHYARHRINEDDKHAEDAVITGHRRNQNQRRSKAGRQLAEEALKIKTEQGIHSPVKHPECVTTTTHTESLTDYRPVTKNPRHLLGEIPDAFPIQQAGANGQDGSSSRLRRIRNWLTLLVQAGLELPPNPLDSLIQECGGTEKVAELTGRKGLMEFDNEKNVARYKARQDDNGPAKELNLREKDKFMNGDKRIAIISDAASTGISLQADKRYHSRHFRRLHITLELPWSADKAVQQFGRSHRANQQSAPIYKILVTPCGGEFRFASAAAKRLQSLGALLRGDRNAVGAGAELKAFDVDTEPGKMALQRMLKVITSEVEPMPGTKIPELPDNLKLKYGIPLSGEGSGEGSDGAPVAVASHLASASAPNHPSKQPFNIHFCRRLFQLGLLEISQTNLSGFHVPHKAGGIRVAQFLNRLLGLPIEDQDLLFKFFSDTLDATITNLKSEGKYDNGILSLQGNQITKHNDVVILNDPVSGASVRHVSINLVQGCQFEEAKAMVEEAKQRISELSGGTRRLHLSGFYVQRSQTFSLSGVRHPRIQIALEIVDSNSSAGRTDYIKLRMIPPYGQDFPKTRLNKEFRDAHWRLITNLDEAKVIWDAWFNYTATKCVHGDNCADTGVCKEGCRHIRKHMLCGAVLGYWNRLEDLHRTGPFCRKYLRYSTHPTTGNAETKYTPNPLFVGRVITHNPNDPTQSGEPIVGILAESEDEMMYLRHHMVPPRDDPTYVDPLGTNYSNVNAVRGLNAGSDPFIRRGGAGGGAGGSKKKNFR